MIGIYKIENKLNHKIYIGQSINIEERWKQHLYSLQFSNKSWYPVARIESNTIEDFDLSILQECSTDELDELEEYWIQYYDSYNNGYNFTKDGQGCLKTQIYFYLFHSDKFNIEDKFYYYMNNLNNNAFKLWVYLFFQSQHVDKIIYSNNKIREKIGVGENGVRCAIKELIQNKIITVRADKNYEIYF